MRLRHRFGEPLALAALRRYLRCRDAQPAALLRIAAALERAQPSQASSRHSEGRMRRSTRATAAGQAYLDLQNRARAEGRAAQGLLILYVV